jgi:hypothetical protein
LTGVDDLRPHTLTWMTWFLDVGLAEPLHIDAYLCREARFRSLAVITAGVYSDEHEGPAAIAALARVLGSHTPAGSVIAVPVVNPMTLAAAQRSPDGGNAARTFPGWRGVLRPTGWPPRSWSRARVAPQSVDPRERLRVLTGVPVSKE